MRQKLHRFYDNKNNLLIVEPGKEFFDKAKGHWQNCFASEQPLTLEIGCGRGEYTVGLGKLYQERNFIGIDIKGSRIWYGASEAKIDQMTNVAFLRIRIERVADFFAQNEVDEIWITFPGPRPRKKEANKRLTTNKFLDMYKSILKPGGIVHLKTDSDFCYEFTKEVFAGRDDIQIIEDILDINADAVGPRPELHEIQTYYESHFRKQGSSIKYISWRFIE